MTNITLADCWGRERAEGEERKRRTGLEGEVGGRRGRREGGAGERERGRKEEREKREEEEEGGNGH